MVDKDGKFSYSRIVSVSTKGNSDEPQLVVFPTLLNGQQAVQVVVNSRINQKMEMLWHNASRRVIVKSSQQVFVGKNILVLKPSTLLPKGLLYISFKGESINGMLPLISQ
jgi:hypothetical protein